MIKKHFALEKRRKTFLDDIWQTLMLAKNAKAFAKRVKKSFMIGCDVLRISAFKIFQHRDTETQRIIVNGELYGPLYGNYMLI